MEDEYYDDDEMLEEGEASDFSLFMQEQMQYIPWWISSIVIHIIILCLTILVIIEEPPQEQVIEMPTELTEEKQEEFKPEKKRDVFKQEKEVEQEEQVVEDPVVKEAEESDHNETDNNEDFQMSKGKSDKQSDSPLDGKFNNRNIGLGGGAGGMFGGRFGGRKNLRALGGSKATESAVQSGLLWLKRHQSPDGKWDADNFTQNCGKEAKFPGSCGGTGSSWVDPGVTGIALLCFLGAGNSTSIGEFKRQVKNGVRYLKQIQAEDGCYGPRSGAYMYNHAIATLAMAEAYTLSNHNPMLKDSAQRGVNFLIKAQNPYQGWRYSYQCKDNDTSVTGWCVMALKSAKVGGLEVQQSSFTGARNFIDSVTDKTYYRTGYTKMGNSVRGTESMTAVGMTSRVFMGDNPNTDSALIGGAGLLIQKTPVWGKDAQGKDLVDFYYWYYGTLAMFQMGGDNWTSWNDKMKTALVEHQCKGGCKDGSWDPCDHWGKSGSRIYSTGLNILSLEIYYRYAKVFK